MNQIWRKFWGMCLLKVEPHDVPASQTLLVMSVLAYFAISFVLATFNLVIFKALISAAVDIVILLAASYVLLWIKLTPHRWLQTATAMAGTSVILGVVALPVMALQAAIGVDSDALFLPKLILIAIMVWNLIIFAHIFKSALEVSMWMGAVFSGFYMYMSIKILNTLFFPAS